MIRKRFFRLQRLIIGALIGAMTIASTAHAQSPAAIAPRDVRMSADGKLQGVAMDAQGRPLSGLDVKIQRVNGEIHSVKTDASGRFAVAVPAGPYMIGANGGRTLCRVWTAQAAPPRSQAGVLLVASDRVVLGQDNGGKATALVVGGLIIAAAIAIPVALDDDGS